jgi:hypothetical protein
MRHEVAAEATMKITSTQMQLTTSHASQQHHESSETLNFRVGQQRRPTPEAVASSKVLLTDSVTLSDTATQGTSASVSSNDVKSQTENDPRLNLIRSMMEFLTGRRFRIFDSTQLQTSAAPSSPASTTTEQNGNTTATLVGYSFAYDHHE